MPVVEVFLGVTEFRGLLLGFTGRTSLELDQQSEIQYLRSSFVQTEFLSGNFVPKTSFMEEEKVSRLSLDSKNIPLFM